MEIKTIFSYEKLRSGILLTLKITFICGLIFFIINGNYTFKSFLITMGMSAMYSIFLCFIQGVMNDYLSTKWSWVYETNKRIWSGIIVTVIYTVIAILIIHYVLYVKVNGLPVEKFFKGALVWEHLFLCILSFGISAFLHARGFMIEWKNSVTKETTEQKIVAKTETAKFETLKSQIDPHFLFNSLNVLTSLIGENPKQAERFTTKLSKIYRYVLEQRNKDLVPIEEELKFAKTYMELLQMRFEDALTFEVPSMVSNKELKIVPLSLQLLLENAVKHNIVSPSKPLQISIYEEGGYLKVVNNVNPKEAIGAKSTKVGLQNIADRYGLISDRDVLIENNKKTFTVNLPTITKTKASPKKSEDFENSSYIKAVEKVEKIKEFYRNLITYLIFIPIFVFINLRFSPHFHWFYFPIVGWGIGVLFHGLEVYNYNFLLGKDWEEKKIKEIMDKDKF